MKNPAIWKNPIHFLAFGFGSGLLPKMPGTWGALLGVLLYRLIDGLALLPYLIVVIAAFLLGIYLCEKTSNDLGVEDHPGIVWDEIVGFWLVMIAVPSTWMFTFIGFVLFRFFDIIKPWPINLIEARFKGGLGIMLDDAMAAFYAWVILQIIVYFLH